MVDARMPASKAARNKNKHRGNSFERFLKKDGLHEEVQAAAFKRAVALKLGDLTEQKRVNKSAMAAQMRTSRAAIHRLLDPENTSVTLVTLNRATRSLGRKVEIELVPA
jgi:DNA-binding Xre family transcriptional regulator